MLVRYCLLEGVNYPLFVKALKPVFARAARLELQKGEVKINDSAVSMLSGLHRKDVRELSQSADQPMVHSGSAASLLFTKWVSDPCYVLKNGKPRRLAKNGRRRPLRASPCRSRRTCIPDQFSRPCRHRGWSAATGSARARSGLEAA